MPIFDPPDLEERLMKAVKEFHNILGEESTALFDHDRVQPSNWNPKDESFLIRPESSLDVDLPDCLYAFQLTCTQFLALLEELRDATIEDNLECWTMRRLLLRISPAPEHGEYFFGDILGVNLHERGTSRVESFALERTIEGRAFRCLVRGGLTAFGVLIAAGDDYEEYFPPILPEDLFVEVSFDGPIDKELIRNVAYSYLFELGTSLEVDLVTDPRPVLYGEADEHIEIGGPDEVRIRPLMIGTGITDVIRLYVNAMKSSTYDVKLLQFYKVLEHVSATVVHQHLIQTTRAKLLSASALHPSAEFILELQSLFEQNRDYIKDREAIKLTLKTCCEATELLKVAPRFLQEKLSGPPDSLTRTKAKDRQDQLARIGECVVATRNALVHSKTSYIPTGEECPTEQLPQLVKCIRLAAQQVIRWYHAQPQELRIV